MFDIVKFITRLEQMHTGYNISIDSIHVKRDGWLIQFTCLGKQGTGLERAHYERVAFFGDNDGAVADLKWSQIC